MTFFEGYPTTVSIGGDDVPIQTDFRAFIELDRIIEEGRLDRDDADQTILDILLLFFSREAVLSYDPIDLLFDGIFCFYTRGEVNRKKLEEESKKRKKRESSPKRAYSFIEDMGYINSAFIQEYGINLRRLEPDYMHWYDFVDLLQSLSPKCKFSEIVGYRTTEITPNMSQEQKKFYRRMKRVYALKDRRTEQEKSEDFANAFLQ